jgi:diaminopimelate decarboxylase
MSLDLVRAFPTVKSLNLGGGYKVARMADEKATDLQEIGEPVKKLFQDFAEETGRKLKLEIEPGTFLLAHACSLGNLRTGCNINRFRGVSLSQT